MVLKFCFCRRLDHGSLYGNSGFCLHSGFEMWYYGFAYAPSFSFGKLGEASARIFAARMEEFLISYRSRPVCDGLRQYYVLKVLCANVMVMRCVKFLKGDCHVFPDFLNIKRLAAL